MEKAMSRDKIHVNDRQLACAHISSKEGQNYLKGMAAAANYAWVNRSSMTFLTRQVSLHCSFLIYDAINGYFPTIISSTFISSAFISFISSALTL